MTDRLHLAMFSELEETVDSCTHRDTSGVVVRGSEMAECLAFDLLHLSGFRIIFLLYLLEVPVHSVLDTRGDIDVFECREVRKSDLECMCHTVLEFIPESGFVEFGCLEVYPVLEGSIVTEGEFLIEFLLSYPMLSLERIESAHRECHVRERE